MPQNTQQTLIHVLLFWTTILSIIQIVFIILLFTGGHHGPLQFQNKSTEAPGVSMKSQETLSSCKDKHDWGMLSYKATGDKVFLKSDKNLVKWVATSTDSGFISEGGHDLKIKKDGYFFLTLQVTMEHEQICKGSAVNVKLKRDTTTTLLEGMINPNTCSTGLLGKVHTLSAGFSLTVTINSSDSINTNPYLTHLDVIYLCKP